MIVITVVTIVLLTTLWDVLFPNRFDVSIFMISERQLNGYSRDISQCMQSIVEDYDNNKKQKVYVFSTELSSDTSSLLKVQSKLSNDLTSGKYYLLLLDQSSYD